MIPISRDQHLKHTIDGVTYLMLPPVGDVEVKVVNCVSRDDYNIQMMNKHYDRAVEDLGGKLKGMKKTNSKYQRLVKEKILEYIEEDKDAKYEFDSQQLDDLINIILVGWESKAHKLPEFKKGDCAGDMQSMLKSKLQAWYISQYNPGDDEVKK